MGMATDKVIFLDMLKDDQVYIKLKIMKFYIVLQNIGTMSHKI